MKKQLIAGMLAIATIAAAAAPHFAHAATTKGAVKEALADYSAKIKESAFGAGKTAKGLSAQQLKVARDKIIKELNLDGSKVNSLSTAVAMDSGRLDALATIVAAKKMATEVARTDASEAKSIEDAANATAKLLANSTLVGQNKSAAKDLDAAQLKETTDSLVKLESITETILVRFDKAERDSFTQVLNKHDQLIDSGAKQTSEEAFVQAIMDVKKVSKDKALEIVRKLKECV